MIKKLITMLIMLMYLVDSTGVNGFSLEVQDKKETLRPAASVLSPADVDSAVETLKTLLEDQPVDGLDLTASDQIKELIRVLAVLTELKAQQPLPVDRLCKIQMLLNNRLLSPSLRKAMPETIIREAKQLNSEIKQLLTDVAFEVKPEVLPDAPRDSERKKTPPLKRLREIGITLLSVAAIIIFAHYAYGYYLAGRALSLPLSTVLTASTIGLLGDYLRQRGQVVSGSQKKMDWGHLLRWGIVTFLLDGLAIGYFWHDLSLVGSGSQRVIKIVTDQTLFAPSYFLPFGLTLGRWFIEKKPFNQAIKDAIKMMSSICVLLVLIWPAALYLAYFVTTPEAPILTITITKLIWVTMVSYLLHRFEGERPNILKRNFRAYRMARYIWVPAMLALFFIYPSWPLAIVTVMALTWSSYFTRKLKGILSTDGKGNDIRDAEEEADDMSADELAEYAERLEDVRLKILILQRHLAEHLLNELRLPQAKVVAAGQRLLKHKALRRLETAG